MVYLLDLLPFEVLQVQGFAIVFKISSPSRQLILEVDLAALYQELVVRQVSCWHPLYRLLPRGWNGR